ncbi:MAG: hypothetical protein JWQ45_406 [Blastococcus sp.]|jgi:hypothetical protein|nr:hypothetical protein [Blastococcus sp.]
MGDDDRTTLEVRQPGFEGQLTIGGPGGARTVGVTGTRPQDGAAVVKDVPADRDPELSELVRRVLSGEDGAAARLLAHIGVLDPT